VAFYPEVRPSIGQLQCPEIDPAATVHQSAMALCPFGALSNMEHVVLVIAGDLNPYATLLAMDWAHLTSNPSKKPS